MVSPMLRYTIIFRESIGQPFMLQLYGSGHIYTFRLLSICFAFTFRSSYFPSSPPTLTLLPNLQSLLTLLPSGV